MKKFRCYLEIDLAAYAHNLKRIRELVPDAKVMAVIKANAYGHGMEMAADQLADADEFAVTSVDDARRLLKHGVTKPMSLLSADFSADDLDFFVEHNIRPVIYDYEQLSILKSFDRDAQLNVWLKVDTGMGRLGFAMDEIANVRAQLEKVVGIEQVSLMTHLANADRPQASANAVQFDKLDYVLEQASDHQQNYQQISVLNSAGVVGFADRAHDFVRPGIMLYGISPQAGLSADKLGLKPVMTLKSSIISVRRMPAGTSIGYGGTYTLDQDSRIAYIGCGYGDGYPRHAANGTTVCVNGFLVPLVGRVSMDMIAVDVGELPVAVGDQAILWGAENPIEDVAEAAKTIAYELTCGITERVKRVILPAV